MAYSSNSGDATATDMITTLKNWADVCSADALIQIGGTTATVRQVCTPSLMILVQEVPLPENFLEVL